MYFRIWKKRQAAEKYGLFLRQCAGRLPAACQREWRRRINSRSWFGIVTDGAGHRNKPGYKTTTSQCCMPCPAIHSASPTCIRNEGVANGSPPQAQPSCKTKPGKAVRTSPGIIQFALEVFLMKRKKALKQKREKSGGGGGL